MSGRPDAPKPIRAGAMHRADGATRGMTARQRNEDVGFPCRNSIGAPSPVSTYDMCEPRSSIERVLVFPVPMGSSPRSRVIGAMAWLIVDAEHASAFANLYACTQVYNHIRRPCLAGAGPGPGCPANWVDLFGPAISRRSHDCGIR